MVNRTIEEVRRTVQDIYPYAKAVVSFLTALLGILVLFLNLSADGMDAGDWSTLAQAAVAALVGTGLVYGVPNKVAK